MRPPAGRGAGAAQPGDVLVIDDGGRVDEACIGDLAVLEARTAGVAGIVVWGRGRACASRPRSPTMFADHLPARARNPGHTLRAHLRGVGGAVEE